MTFEEAMRGTNVAIVCDGCGEMWKTPPRADRLVCSCGQEVPYTLFQAGYCHGVEDALALLQGGASRGK